MVKKILAIYRSYRQAILRFAKKGNVKMRPNNCQTTKIVIMAIIFLTIFGANSTFAKDRFSLMPFITITTGDGEPAHDIPRIGLQGRFRLNPDLYLTTAVSYTEYDFERPYKLLAIDSKKEVAAKVSGIIFDVGAEREFIVIDLLKPYVGGGVGFSFISAETIAGTSLNGKKFRISTDTGTEFIPYLNGGIRWLLWQNLSLDLGTRLEYHLSDWVVTDRVSRLSNSIENYFQYGGYIGFALAF